MPYHTFNHNYNTKYKKDPAIERWVYQRYYGQTGQFQPNGRALTWLVVLFGVVPYAIYRLNERGVAWMDQHRAEDINSIRMGRTDLSKLKDFRD